LGVRSLYISYDGALDPLGQSQVLPYLMGLADRGIQWDFLSFEKPIRFADREGRERLQRKLQEAGIRWRALKYHRRPSLLATLYDMVRGVVAASRLVRTGHIQVVHSRSYVAATMAWTLKKLFGVPFIFDMRGFFAEERVEGSIWPIGGTLYRMTKRVESRLLAEADQIVSLSEAGREVLTEWAQQGGFKLPPVHVIPTCVECDRFRPSKWSSGSSDRAIILMYLGSLGTWYMLDEMLAFFRVFRRLKPEARFNFFTPDPPATIYEAASALGIERSVLLAKEVPHEAVPSMIQGVHASVFFIRPVSSKRASCPTKMGESLACGIPVVINPGVGDTETIVRKERIGVVVQDWTEEAYDQAARELVGQGACGVVGRRARLAAAVPRGCPSVFLVRGGDRALRGHIRKVWLKSSLSHISVGQSGCTFDSCPAFAQKDLRACSVRREHLEWIMVIEPCRECSFG